MILADTIVEEIAMAVPRGALAKWGQIQSFRREGITTGERKEKPRQRCC
jgi:hypothetical protein